MRGDDGTDDKSGGMLCLSHDVSKQIDILQYLSNTINIIGKGSGNDSEKRPLALKCKRNTETFTFQ
jgi:hypothetical protein